MHGCDGDDTSAHDRELARLLVSETREEVLKADQKASLMLSALGLMLVALIGAVTSDGISPERYAFPPQALFWTGCAAWIPSLVTLGVALLPRTGLPRAGRAHYFEDVAAMPSLTGLGTIVRRTDPLERDVSQLAALSRLVSVKYRCIRRGMVWSGVFLVLTPLGVLLGSAG
ncbi:Pycsar system effector family protein [Streptomyces radicis]|uniref:Pycsar effector protein domain-containing protein n=1 Tax=Streptomyces radicis TaxID=1750517 RepID=A0A3A9WFR5_9ACTN|nr:Pycsar system effector family protein [Streptomyces radicis]RKN11452.1 hypothetical protein D7319_05785 [Streptomyces radicis]RKN26528.1 hypothetical protein D7318_03875 [Streptomyces radicis]